MAATIYGVPEKVTMCTHISGAAGSETPDVSQGDVIYFYTQKINGMPKSLETIKNLAGGSSYGSKSGKKDIVINLIGNIVVKWTGGLAPATNTDAFNYVMDFLYKYSLKTAAPRIYLFMQCSADGDAYIKPAHNSSHVQTRMIKGKPLEYPWDLDKGNLYTIARIPFKQVTLG